MSKQSLTIGLVGNPNCGKTTLFNGITGGKQHIGNWPGVTVEKKEGNYKHNDTTIQVVDLPGIYSLSAQSEDEQVARDYILSGEPDAIINIIDATNLERNLYLTTQLLEMKIPLIVILNRIDLANKDNIEIDLKELEQQLNCPVLAMSAIKKSEIREAREQITGLISQQNISQAKVEYPNEIEDTIKKWHSALEPLADQIGSNSRWIALKLIEGDYWTTDKVVASGAISKTEITECLNDIEKILDEPGDIIIADYRYGFIHGLTHTVVKNRVDRQKFSDRLDKVILNRILGIPIFLGIMYIVFWVTMAIGGAFIDFFDIAFGTIFVDGFAELLTSIGSPEWLKTILANGVGSGIQTVSTFIPIIFAMFFMLSLLEDSGYMARAAFVMDRFMRAIGLPGKSFVPMLVGFGCSIPAIMATRTLESKKDRMLTVFMAPFMSCGARLPVYVLFAAAFFPNSSGTMVFSLYAVGIVLAIITGLLLKKTLFRGEPSHFVMELPVYNPPRIKHIMIHTWNRLKQFMFRAGKVIVIVVTVLSFLNSFGTDGSFGNEDNEKSVLSKIGKTITPVFTPMGIDEKNWPASVAVFTGIFAKEAVVGTLNSLYSQNTRSDKAKTDENETASSGDTADTEAFSLTTGLSEAFKTIPENLSGIFGGLADPLGTALLEDTGDQGKITEELELNTSTFSNMIAFFSKGAAQAYAYLLFILIYFPCVAALGVVVREVGHKMAWIQAAYLTVLGWVVATLFYQVTVGHQVVWIIIPLLILALIILGFRSLAKTNDYTILTKAEDDNAAN